MLKDKKRYFVLAGLVVLLVLAGYVNYRLNNPEDTPAAADAASQQRSFTTPEDGAQAPGLEAASGASSENYFASFRQDRDRTRAEEIRYLDDTINDERTDAETLKDAQEQKLYIVDSMEKEMTIEGLLKAQGFNDAVVTLHRGSVYVVVDAPVLTNENVAQVLSIVQQETGEKPEAIKVVPRVQ